MDEVLGDVRYLVGTPRGGKAPIFTRCPNPEHGDSGRANYAVYPDGGYCFRCGFRESARTLSLRLGSSEETLQGLPPRDLVRPGAGVGDRGQAGPAARRADPQFLLETRFYHRLLTEELPERQAYLVERAILPETIRRWQLGHDGGFFVIPVWNGSEVRGFKLRADPLYRGEHPPKYINQCGTELFRPNPAGRLTVIVEGEFDALAVAQYGFDAVTTTTGCQGLRRLDWLGRGARPVVIAVDQDEAGEHAAARLTDSFPAARRARFPGKDITDALKALPLLARRRELARWLEVC